MTGPSPIHADDEERLAAEMGRELEALAARSAVQPPVGFADQVMAAVADEPLPQPARALGAALGAGRMGAALGSIRDAWRVAVGGSAPLWVRGQALALVLVVAIGSLAMAGGATVGAIGLLNAIQPPDHTPTAPLPSQPLPSEQPSSELHGPVVLSIKRADPNPTNAESVSWTVTFDEPVSGVDTGDFGMDFEGIGGTPMPIAFTPAGPSDVYTITWSTGDGARSGTVGIFVVDDNSIVDSLGQPLGGPGTDDGDFRDGEVYTIDRDGPVVLSILRADPNPTAADFVNFTLTFDEPVSGLDVGDFSTEGDNGLSGTPAITAITPAGPSSVYTVTMSTGTGNGTVGISIIDDNSIVDSLGQPLGGGGIGDDFRDGELYTIDRDGPIVVSINRADPNPTAADVVSWTVTFNESVSGVDATDFDPFNDGGLGFVEITSVTPAGPTNVYTVTASTGTGDGTLGLSLFDDGSITDLAGNDLDGTTSDNGGFEGEVYTIDRPTATGTDDHGGGSGSGGGGGSGSGGGDETPSPTATGTDDRGGGG